MTIVRILIVLIVVVAGVLGFVYYRTGNVPTSPQAVLSAFQGGSPPSAPDFSQLSSLQVPTLPDGTAEQFETFEARASSVSASIGAVLGTAIQEASGSGKIQDKVFEYGRYLYCQQVVQEYEAKETE